MSVTDITIAVLSLISGIGVFLVACKMMSTGMETLSGERLKSMFKKVSGNAFLGVGIGALTSALIQSSGATTVMVLGFVNARIMSMFQAVTLIYGASIGTTIVGLIVALGMLGDGGISTTVIFATFAGIGSFITIFAKNDKWLNIGSMLAGFGMLFVGLSLMSSSMAVFAQDESVREILANAKNPFLVIVFGTILTALINSSAAVISIAITMLYSGLICIDQGIYIALGANVGSSITGLIAALTGTVAAKRCAVINVLYKIYGVIIYIILTYLIMIFVKDFSFGQLLPGKPQVQLALFHSIFNCFVTILILPITVWIIRLSKTIIPNEKVGEGETEDKPRLHYVNDNMLRTPSIAVEQLKNEIINMADISIRNFNLACEIVCSLDYKHIEDFRKNEIELNFINKELVKFVVRLSKLHLGERDRSFLSTTIKTISDLERVGDYAENIVEYADSLKNNKDKFSPQAVTEIKEVMALVENLYDLTMKAYIHNNLTDWDKINSVEDTIDERTKEMELNHIKRLDEGVCTPNVGAQYLSLATNIERIGDHYLNVAKAVSNSNLN